MRIEDFTGGPDAATPGPLPSAARLIEWVEGAQRGARLVYASGPSCRASCGAIVADLVEALSTKGFVTAHFQKVEGTGRYLVQRTQRAPLTGELTALIRASGSGGRR